MSLPVSDNSHAQQETQLASRQRSDLCRYPFYLRKPSDVASEAIRSSYRMLAESYILLSYRDSESLPYLHGKELKTQVTTLFILRFARNSDHTQRATTTSVSTNGFESIQELVCYNSKHENHFVQELPGPNSL